MGRKRKEQIGTLTFKNLEFTFQPGFENDWSKVLAELIFTQVKHQLEEGDNMD